MNHNQHVLQKIVFISALTLSGLFLAAQEERKELENEGIDLISIPWTNKDN